MNVNPPKIVLWKFDLTESKKNFPKMLDIVGIKRAPHNTLVADTGFDKGGRSLELGLVDSVLVVASDLKILFFNEQSNNIINMSTMN